MQKNGSTTNIDIGRFCRWLIVFLLISEVMFVSLHMIVIWSSDDYSSGVRRMFHLSREGNLPTWFSSTQFFILGLILIVIYLAERLSNPDKKLNFIWLVAGMGAIFLAADESARLHERFGTVLGDYIDDASRGSLLDGMSSFPSYYWAIIYAPLALPTAIFLGWFFWREFDRLRDLPIVGMTLFLIGAVVLDYLEGAYGTDDHGPFDVEIAWLGINKAIDTQLIEEGLEMLGVTLVLIGCLLHASKLLSRFAIVKLPSDSTENS